MGALLRVDNLSMQVTCQDLIDRLGDCGIVEAAIMDSSSANSSRHQSAFVMMTNSKEAQAAIDWLHHTQFKGSEISVARVKDDAECAFWFHPDLPG